MVFMNMTISIDTCMIIFSNRVRIDAHAMIITRQLNLFNTALDGSIDKIK